jgi:hypothetical protein
VTVPEPQNFENPRANEARRAVDAWWFWSTTGLCLILVVLCLLEAGIRGGGWLWWYFSALVPAYWYGFAWKRRREVADEDQGDRS